MCVWTIISFKFEAITIFRHRKRKVTFSSCRFVVFILISIFPKLLSLSQDNNSVHSHVSFNAVFLQKCEQIGSTVVHSLEWQPQFLKWMKFFTYSKINTWHLFGENETRNEFIIFNESKWTSKWIYASLLIETQFNSSTPEGLWFNSVNMVWLQSAPIHTDTEQFN